ncbi:prostaglandin E2 receptor EP4 subtype-like isoform X1 [Ostrea edulis]|uniref:prostaglandin E2 receptor EP4 subtype-like isoform X1 n=1 Tax=Ostrea edulis TaxID=37623 RepID=UPI0024AFB38E|nr:prostaglandin E2 receptor EP4 subtype-like isoform X1 [Ostrea edulis]
MDINVTPSYDFPLCYRNDTATSWVPTSMEFFFGVFGNFIALILLWINRHDHRWDSFYKLFTGLVITDFIGVIVVYPIATIRYASDFTWCYPKNLCKFVSFIFVDAHLSGALLICAMAVDRFMYSVSNTISNRTYTFILIGIWIIASLVSLLHLIGVGQSNLYFPGSWCYFDFINDTTGNRIMSYLYSIFGFIIVFVTILMYVITMIRICRNPERSGYFLDANRVSGYYDSHVMVFMTAVTVLFVILWTPFLVDVFLHATNIRTQHDNNKVELWLVRNAVNNAMLDPWLYIVLRKESLRKFVLFYRKCRGASDPQQMKKPGVDETDILLPK